MANKNLGEAKRAKNDEFYTQYEDIQKEVNAYLKTDLLIYDECGYVPFEKDGSQLLFQVISECYEKRSDNHNKPGIQ